METGYTIGNLLWSIWPILILVGIITLVAFKYLK